MAMFGLLLAALPGAPILFAEPPLPPEAALETLRQRGDIDAERRHVWELIAKFTATRNTVPQFQTWHGEGELFSPGPSRGPGLRGFSRTGISNPENPDVPVLTYTLYNDAAYSHIIGHHLNEAAALDALRQTGSDDTAIAGNRDVPAFPSDSIVLKTVWWPVAREGITALPVWDPGSNPPNRNGNPYTGWRRVVGVDPTGAPQAADTVAISFAGSNFSKARRVGLSSFDHVEVDKEMATAMMADPETRKAVLIALGRPLAAGDHLILVAANLAAREIPDWIWGTFWWHDQAQKGPYAAGRPKTLTGPWRNYLMQAAFDTEKPAAADGGPHIAFDPWLEGRFPDGGHGGGGASNCMACHLRASYPAVPFLPVTRGGPDLHHDAAFAPDRLRTSLLWSLAMHAKKQTDTTVRTR
jgi:hypothetical protein